MRPFDFELIQQLADSDYVARLIKRYGNETRVELLLALVREVFKYLPPEGLASGTAIFYPVTDNLLPLGQGVMTPKADLASMAPPPLVIGPCDSGSVTCWADPIDLLKLSSYAIVYQFDGSDRFVTPDGVIEVPSLPAFASIFAVPTFADLEDALEHYRVNMARRSRCPILRSCWDDTERLVLRNLPESRMRESLETFLVSTLRTHDRIEVRPEQTVDDSHRVDIKVTWSFGGRIAYIEIKWLGDSVNADRTRLTRYRDSRACEGAEQLAGYLDSDKTRSSGYSVMGYLVVVDARRRGLDIGNRNITDEQALFYAQRDINYTVQYELQRRDFAKPMRMFLEPILASH